MQPVQSSAVEITDLAYGGDGVGRMAGRVCFVPFTLPGERVSVRLTQATKRYARAEVVDILTPAPERVQPPCPYFRVCGGCRYQHVDYAAQVRWKQKQVVDILTRIGQMRALPIAPMIPSPRAYGYRNKITLHGAGPPAFRALTGRHPVAIARCALAAEPINVILREQRLRTLAANEHLVIRSNRAGVARWFTETGGRPTATDGQPGVMTEKILNQFYDYPLTSFFQVNPEVLGQILAVAGKRAAPPGATLIDAYCGAGVCILALTGRDQRGIGIEIDSAAVAAAKTNAARQDARQVNFRHGRAETCLPQALRDTPAAETCLILDPPRAGCTEQVLRSVANYRPGRILYLSCVPPILARDLQRLTGSGYRLVRVQPFDMFPQTAHIECLAELEYMG